MKKMFKCTIVLAICALFIFTLWYYFGERILSKDKAQIQSIDITLMELGNGKEVLTLSLKDSEKVSAIVYELQKRISKTTRYPEHNESLQFCAST